jgi:hypothetical protein
LFIFYTFSVSKNLLGEYYPVQPVLVLIWHDGTGNIFFRIYIPFDFGLNSKTFVQNSRLFDHSVFPYNNYFNCEKMIPVWKGFNAFNSNQAKIAQNTIFKGHLIIFLYDLLYTFPFQMPTLFYTRYSNFMYFLLFVPEWSSLSLN